MDTSSGKIARVMKNIFERLPSPGELRPSNWSAGPINSRYQPTGNYAANARLLRAMDYTQHPKSAKLIKIPVIFPLKRGFSRETSPVQTASRTKQSCGTSKICRTNRLRRKGAPFCTTCAVWIRAYSRDARFRQNDMAKKEPGLGRALS